MKKDIEKICLLNKNWQPGNIKVKRVGGQTNRNYKVEYKKIIRFVRLPWEKAEIVDRKVEAKNIKALNQCQKLAKILPQYYLYISKEKNILKPGSKANFNLPDGTMVTDFIDGKDIDGKDLEKPKVQKALLKALQTFHSSGVKFANPYDVFRDEVLKYKNQAKKFPITQLIKNKTVKEIEKIEKTIKKELKLGGKISTHNDLIFENLRLGKNGKVYLLDFEYGGFNIREGLHYDLGIILGGNLFQKNPLKIKTFEQIFQKAQKIYKKDLNHYKIYCGALTNVLVMFWWGVVKYFSCEIKKEKKYFKDYVLKRAQGIKYLFNIIRGVGFEQNQLNGARRAGERR